MSGKAVVLKVTGQTKGQREMEETICVTRPGQLEDGTGLSAEGHVQFDTPGDRVRRENSLE